MDVDERLAIVGLSGRVQNTNFAIFGLGLTLAAVQLTGVTFTVGQSAEHYCKPPPGFSANESTPLIVEDGRLVPDGCRMYEVLNGTLTANTTTCLHGWEYPANDAHGEKSYVTELDLVCDRGYLANLLISVHFAGVMVGGLVTGQAGDLWGRRPVSMATLLLIAALGAAVSFAWSLELAMALRFLLGAALPGNLLVGYVRVVEMFTPKKRLLGHVLVQHLFSLGVMLVAPLAYLMPDWRLFQLVTSLMSIPLIFFMWFFSYESLRWLVQKGRLEQAEATLRKIADSKNLPHHGGPCPVPGPGPPGTPSRAERGTQTQVYTIRLAVTSDIDNGVGEDRRREVGAAPAGERGAADTIAPGGDAKTRKHQPVVCEDKEEDDPAARARPDARKYTVLDLFKTRVLIKRTTVVFCCWFVMNATYFGFIVYSASLVGNKYLNFFLLALAEAPVYVIDFVIVKRFGRKRPVIFFFFAGAVACLLIAFLPARTASGSDLSVLIVAVAMIGKFYANAAFEVTLLMSAEMFPTVLRNVATGSSSTIGRCSAIIAPFIVYLQEVQSYLPMLIFGCLSLVASGLVTLLPETTDKPLPETYEDATKLVNCPERETKL